MERRMSDNFDLDVQGLQDDAPPDTSASLVALAAQLVEVRRDVCVFFFVGVFVLFASFACVCVV